MSRSPTFVLMCLALAFALHPAQVRAASTEAQVKAAYLYKLASFVRWPDSARRGDSMRLCIAGRSDVAAVLETLVRGQRIDDKPVEILSIGAANAEAARSCHVLFLGSGPESARRLSESTQTLPVLTVGDRANRTGGGVVDFIERGGRVRFAVDTAIARARGLQLSSKLLEVAETVQ